MNLYEPEATALVSCVYPVRKCNLSPCTMYVYVYVCVYVYSMHNTKKTNKAYSKRPKGFERKCAQI